MSMIEPKRATTLVAFLTMGCFPSCTCNRPPPLAGPLVYVSDEKGGDLVVVDPVKAEAVTRIKVGRRPRGLKLSRDGKQVYVALSGSPAAGPGVDPATLPPPDRGADGIGVVDVARRALVRTFESGQDPEAFDLSADGKTLYVSNEETAELAVVDTTSGEIRTRVKVGREPEGVTVRPDGKVVFVTSEEDGEITAVDTATLAVVGHVKTAARPRSIVVTRDGRTGFAACELGAAVTAFDAVAFTPAETIPLHEDSPMPSGPRPMGAVLSADEKLLYVTCGRGGSLAVVDVATRKQVRSIDGVGDRPWGVAWSADGKSLYTANGTSNDLSIVNPVTGNVDKRVHLGGMPWGVVASQ
jgi:YVTN family beta-propeller protein